MYLSIFNKCTHYLQMACDIILVFGCVYTYITIKTIHNIYIHCKYSQTGTAISTVRENVMHND